MGQKYTAFIIIVFLSLYHFGADATRSIHGIQSINRFKTTYAPESGAPFNGATEIIVNVSPSNSTITQPDLITNAPVNTIRSWNMWGSTAPLTEFKRRSLIYGSVFLLQFVGPHSLPRRIAAVLTIGSAFLYKSWHSSEPTHENSDKLTL